MARFFNAKNLHSLPDGGLDEKGKRKQKLYTDEHHRSFKLLVTGNSRLFYSQWEKPKHMLKESQKRQPRMRWPCEGSYFRATPPRRRFGRRPTPPFADQNGGRDSRTVRCPAPIVRDRQHAAP